MPGTPSECKEHAANCREFATRTTDSEAQQHFLRLAFLWDQLAAELESTPAFLNTVKFEKPPNPPSAKA